MDIDGNKKNRILACVITGMENSGTTFLSKLIASNPKIMCGFECGLLFYNVEIYSQAIPWYNWMSHSTDNGHWGILPENLEKITKSTSYSDAYRLIKKHSGDIGSPKVKKCFQKAEYIIDKTPGYLNNIDNIIEKIDAPFLVIKKSIYLQYLSAKKRNMPIYNFINKHNLCHNKLLKSLKNNPEKIMVIDYEQIISDRDNELKKIYKFIKLEYYPESSIDQFFIKTGLADNALSTFGGGLKRNFSTVENKNRITLYEKILLSILDEFPIQKPGFLTLVKKTIKQALITHPVLFIYKHFYFKRSNW